MVGFFRVCVCVGFIHVSNTCVDLRWFLIGPWRHETARLQCLLVLLMSHCQDALQVGIFITFVTFFLPREAWIGVFLKALHEIFTHTQFRSLLPLQSASSESQYYLDQQCEKQAINCLFCY